VIISQLYKKVNYFYALFLEANTTGFVITPMSSKPIPGVRMII